MALVTDRQAVVIGAAVLVGGYLVYLARNKFNPANPDNIANETVTAVGQAVTGDDAWTLGGQIYDWLHPFESYELNPESAPMWWKIKNPQYLTDTVTGG